jgi:quercetin dioxygenase-like cupin family protein
MPTFSPTHRAFVLAAAATGIISAVAFASPPSNFVGTPLTSGALDQSVQKNSDRVKFQTKGSTDTAEIRFDLGADASSGWHHHPGIVIVQVASGSVTVSNGSCDTKVYGPASPNGSVFVEGNTIHRVTSDAGAVAYGTFVVDEHDPLLLRIEDDAPPCATGPAIRRPKR